eukprot:2445912-Prymnesium_polylepis.1
MGAQYSARCWWARRAERKTSAAAHSADPYSHHDEGAHGTMAKRRARRPRLAERRLVEGDFFFPLCERPHPLPAPHVVWPAHVEDDDGQCLSLIHI